MTLMFKINKRCSTIITYIVIMLILGGGSYLSAKRLYLMRDIHSPLDTSLYLPNGNYLKVLALDFDSLLSDLFWIKGSIYFGSQYRKKQHECKWLYHILDLSTDLDPKYYDVYWYGSSILPSVDESIRFLEKGRISFPNDWKIPEMIGFYHHFYLKDYLSAANYYEIASNLPGHPPYVPSLSGRFYTEAGDIESAIRVLKNFHDTCDRKDLKNDFAKRIKQMEDIKILEGKLDLFKKRFKKNPRNLSELVKTGFISTLPREPYGGKYLWDARKDRIISSTSPLYKDT